MPRQPQKYKCKSCDTEDPAAFHHRSKSKCRQCIRLSQEAKRILDQENQTFLSQSKTCTICHRSLHSSFFNSPHSNHCKNCKSSQSKSRRSQNYALYAWKNAKYRAAKKNIAFTISVDDIHIPNVCPVLGIPLIPSQSSSQPSSPSLDRIDNSKGYTPDNIKVISWRANSLKADASLDEIKKILAYMESASAAAKPKA